MLRLDFGNTSPDNGDLLSLPEQRGTHLSKRKVSSKIMILQRVLIFQSHITTIKFLKNWHKVAPPPPPPPTSLHKPLPLGFTIIYLLKYHHPFKSSYTDGSFTPLDINDDGNIAGSVVFNDLLPIQIATKLPCFPNILRVE